MNSPSTVVDVHLHLAPGLDVVVDGTDKPYANTSELRLGDAAGRAVRVINPRRLLRESDAPTQVRRPARC